VAEIGDVTFFQTALFATWCPVRGIRRGHGTHLERTLVLMGSILALTLRVVARQLDISFSKSTGEGVAPLAVSVLMAGLAVRAYFQLCRDRALSSAGTLPRDEKPAPSMAGSASAPGGSYLGNFKAYDPSEYARRGNPFQSEDVAEEAQPLSGGANPSYGGVTQLKEEEAESSTSSKLTALFLPFLVTYLAEAGSQGMELQVLHDSRSMSGLAGGFVGYVLAAMMAGATSFILERQVSTGTLLVGIACGTAAISLACLRSACLHLLAAAYSLPLGGRIAADSYSLLQKALSFTKA